MQTATECSYIGCGKRYAKGLQLHLVPVKNSALCVKWLINSGQEEFLSQKSDVLESMNLAICSDHFQNNNYIDERTLKEEAVPRQYWDHGYSEELGEIREANIDQDLQDYSDDCLTSINLESDPDIETGDELQTQLGNEIEVLLNSIQNFTGRSKQGKKINFGQSLQGFYKKLNSKGNQYKKQSDATCMNDFVKFRRATKNMCRTCAEKKSNLVNVTDDIADSNIGILTKLKLLIEIKSQDVLPKKICQECLTKLEQSYEFIQQIYRADNTLRDMTFACNRSSNTVSDKDKYNDHAVRTGDSETKTSTRGDETEDICSEVNDLPFQTILKGTGVINNGAHDTSTSDVYMSNSFYWQMNDGNKIRDKSSLNSEAYSSENTENAVSYLLSDFSDNDAELSWLDVVGVMEKKHKSEVSKTNTTLGESPAYIVQISCKYCDKNFKLRRQLKTHIIMEHLRPTNYVCEYCNICCRSREHLLKHLVQTHFKSRYKCNDCNEKFSNKEDLRFHIERIHSEIGSIAKTDIIHTPHANQTFTCNDCKETFSSKKILCNHIHRLHPPFAYTCTICKSVMYSAGETYEHMSTHNYSPLFPCFDCGRMFYSTDGLKKHKITHAKSMPKKRKRVWFHCQLCDASYSIVNKLFEHIETHSSEDWKNYKNKILYCGECNARIIGKEKFRIHKMRHHLAKRGDFICLLCNEVVQDFKSLGDYKKHVDSHFNQLKRSAQTYRCEHCNKAFESHSDRMNHTESFHSDLTYSCPICDVKLNDSGNLKYHMDEVHNTKGQQVKVQDLEEEQIPSRICEEKQKHDQVVHQEVFKDSGNSFPLSEQYICDQCDIKFCTVHILEQHILDKHGDTKKATATQTLEKNDQCKWKCMEGEETPDQKIVLDTYVEAHSGMEHASFEDGIKPELGSVLKEHSLTYPETELSYKCQYCEKQFNNDESKNNHELNHHLNNTKSNGGDSSKQDHHN